MSTHVESGPHMPLIATALLGKLADNWWLLCFVALPPSLSGSSPAPNTDEGRPEISKHDLAALFLEYYWPLEVKYHIRQGIDPDKDPVVMKRIRELIKAGNIGHGDASRFQKVEPDKHKMLVARVAREAFDDVVPRFHQVRGVPIFPKIYSFTGWDVPATPLN
jgi:hypothetical protein